MRKIECCHCHKVFEAKSSKAKYCSWLCKKIEITKNQFPDGSSYVECKICGLRGRQLIQHIEKVHGMTVGEYCARFGLIEKDLQTADLHEQMSKGIKKAAAEGRCGFQKGGANPAQSDKAKAGRFSAWSKNFQGYDGMTDEEKEKEISKLASNVANLRKEHGTQATTLEYYLNKGMTVKEAEKALAERQRTFTLEKCIEKYGPVEGPKVYQKRQDDWLATLDAKSPEEKKRINRAKVCQCRNVVAYSKISQKLFSAIYEKIKGEFKDIYFATKIDNGKNNEFEVICKDEYHRYFLDFYVKDNNKVIEFDGDYWHGQKRGNQQRDQEREDILHSLGYVNILRIRECDYKADPDAAVEQCVEFIRGN